MYESAVELSVLLRCPCWCQIQCCPTLVLSTCQMVQTGENKLVIRIHE